MITLKLDSKAFEYPDVEIPRVWTVRQKVEAPVLQDIQSAARHAMEPLFRDARLKRGAKIAVGVGSRGIANLQAVVRTVITALRDHGCEPFIVPAMGSHGGATPEGQTEVLKSYGISEKDVGAPIRATMEVGQVGTLDDGYPVWFDCNALSADAVMVINRIKPHTDFTGDIESGPCKMLAIGLGKRHGAERIHNFGAQGLRTIMPKVGRKLCEAVNVVGAVALIENPYGQTAEIHSLTAKEIGQNRERELLKRARTLSPRLAFDDVDVLVIDEMGKNVSGSGMDTHVIGRAEMPSIVESDWDGPRVRIVCCLDITDDSHGNAAGFGLADMTTRKLIEKIDFPATMTNHRTSGEGGVRRGKIPIIFEDAEACVKAGIGGCGRGKHDQVRLVRIRNTELVETLEISEALVEEARSRNDLEFVGQPHALDLSNKLAATTRA